MRKTQRKRRLKDKRRRERDRGLRNLERLLPIKAAMARGQLKLDEAIAKAKAERLKPIKRMIVDLDAFRPLDLENRKADQIMRAYSRGHVVWN